jgi:hypothetical protein
MGARLHSPDTKDLVMQQTMEQLVWQLATRVGVLERKLDIVCERLGIEVDLDDNNEQYPDVPDLVRQHKLLDAIRIYRDHTGADMRAAKTYVDEMAERIMRGE